MDRRRHYLSLSEAMGAPYGLLPLKQIYDALRGGHIRSFGFPPISPVLEEIPPEFWQLAGLDEQRSLYPGRSPIMELDPSTQVCCYSRILLLKEEIAALGQNQASSMPPVPGLTNESRPLVFMPAPPKTFMDRLKAILYKLALWST